MNYFTSGFKKEIPLFILIVVLILAGFLRFHQLTSVPPGLYPDEAMNGNNANEARRTGEYKVFYPDNNGREGLFINIQAVFLKFLPNEPWVLRLPSAIFGFLTVLGVYFLTKELCLILEKKRNNWSEFTALISTFFIATSFWHINFSRIGFRAIMAPFFLVWALFFFLLALKRIKNKNKNSFFYLILFALIGGLFFGLGFHSYIAFRIMPLLFLFFIPFYYKNKKFWLISFVFIFSSLVAFAPLCDFFLKNPDAFFGRTSSLSIFNSETPLLDLTKNIFKTLRMFNFTGDLNWRHNYAGSPQLYWFTGIFFLIGIYMALRKIFSFKNKIFSKKRFPFLLLLGWIFLASLPVVISNEGLPHALRAIIMIPAVIILAGLGLSFFCQKLRSIKIISYKISVIVLFVFIIIFSCVNVYKSISFYGQKTKILIKPLMATL